MNENESNREYSVKVVVEGPTTFETTLNTEPMSFKELEDFVRLLYATIIDAKEIGEDYLRHGDLEDERHLAGLQELDVLQGIENRLEEVLEFAEN